jgi:sulfite exporter TauE/SafE
MLWQLYLSGFVVGAVGSFHCIGMCGPIAFALPTHLLPPAQKAAGILLYNTGRIATYTLLGLIFGLMGRRVYLGGFQQWFSIMLGVLVLFILLQSLLHKKLLHLRFFDRFNSKIQQWISIFIQRKQLYGMFLLGAANGLLPCGMVYVAITGALAAGSTTGGMLFMTGFGSGTLPAMFLLSYFGFVIGLDIRNKIKKAVPYFVACMGILLILRGMNLNIPFVSPLFQDTTAAAAACH